MRSSPNAQFRSRAVDRSAQPLAARALERIDRAGRWAVAGLGFALPISTALSTAFAALALACWAAGGDWRAKLARYAHEPVARAAALLFAWLLLSLAWAGPWTSAQSEFATDYATLLLLGVFLHAFNDRRLARAALVGLLAAAVLTLALSLALAAGVLPEVRFIKGTPANPVVFKLHITHGLVMALAALLFAALAIERRARWPRIGYATLAALCAINAVWMVQGRTGYVVAAVLALLLFHHLFRWRGLAAAALAVAAIGAGAYAYSPSFGARVDLALAEWSAASPERAAAPSDSIGLRLEFMRNSAAIVAAQPLLGVGLGGFGAAYAEQVAGTDMLATANPHNEYLLLAVQAGVPAALLFGWLLACVWRAARDGAGAVQPLAARGIAAWMAVGCLFNALLIDHTESLLFVWTAALAVALARSDRPGARHA